jgi:hypothetical protein
MAPPPSLTHPLASYKPRIPFHSSGHAYRLSPMTDGSRGFVAGFFIGALSVGLLVRVVGSGATEEQPPAPAQPVAAAAPAVPASPPSASEAAAAAEQPEPEIVVPDKPWPELEHGVPEETEETAKIKARLLCQQTWPDSYAMQADCIDDEMDGFRRLHRD